MRTCCKVIILSIILLLVSCGKKSEFIPDKSLEVNKFPVTLGLKEISPVKDSLPTMGITGFRVIDSLLLVSVNEEKGFWRLYDLPNLELKDSIFNVGGGSGEYDFPIPASYISLLEGDKDKTIISFPFKNNTRIMLMEYEVDDENNLTLNPIEELDLPLSSFPLITFMLDKKRILRYNVVPEEGKLIREILSPYNDNKDYVASIPVMAYLNSMKVDNTSDISALMTIPLIRPDGLMMVEAPYSDNELFISNTVTGENMKIRYPDLENVAHHISEPLKTSEELPVIFEGGMSSKTFFSLLRYNVSEDGKKTEYLDFFSWEGKPLGSIKLPTIDIISVDIYRDKGWLFYHDSNKDKISAYDISNFLNDFDLAE